MSVLRGVVVSGDMTITRAGGDFQCSLEVRGNLHAEGDLHVEEDLIVHGAIVVDGHLSAGGSISADGPIAAGIIHARGDINGAEVHSLDGVISAGGRICANRVDAAGNLDATCFEIAGNVTADGNIWSAWKMAVGGKVVSRQGTIFEGTRI